MMLMTCTFKSLTEVFGFGFGVGIMICIGIMMFDEYKIYQWRFKRNRKDKSK